MEGYSAIRPSNEARARDLCRVGAFLLGAAIPGRAVAQVRLQEREPDEAPPPASAAPAPRVAPKPPAELKRPEPLATPIEYPAGQQVDASVVLELLIGVEGRVEEVRALAGVEPFASAALRAAANWSFSPALRDGKPIAARIRFTVKFEAPRIEEAPSAPTPPPTKPAATTPNAASPAPSPSADSKLEILVVGERKPLRMRLSRAEVAALPGAFGDAFRAIEVLPGVVPIVSGLPYFYIRGAPPGNVGYLFDGIPVPVLYHFGAGPGVLHPAFVDHVDLYSGAYPARYGRYAGGIVTGEMAPPSYAWRAEASIRLLDSGGMVEAPFANQRGSVMLGGRFSYTGAALSLFVKDVILNYWDYQGRIRYALGPRDSLELVAFGSGDLLAQIEHERTFDAQGRETVEDHQNTAVDLGFHRFDLRWDHALANGNFRQAAMFGIDVTRLDEQSVRLLNYLFGVRSELEQRLSTKVQLRAGIDFLGEHLLQRFDTSSNLGSSSEAPIPNGDVAGASPETPSQSSDPDFGFGHSRTDLSFGARGDLVMDVGGGVEFVPGLRADLYVSQGDVALGLDPRVSARYRLSKRLTVSHGLGVAHQMPSFVVTIPGAKPTLKGGLQRALQHSAGIEYQLPLELQASLVLFQNAFFNMTDFIGLARLQDVQGDVSNLRMTGHAYGAELTLRRSLAKRFGFMLSYTLSRSERYAGILSGPATTDRTHVLNLALSYDLGRQWRVGGRGLYYSGIPATVAYLDAARRPPRGPGFYRVDLRLQKRWTIGRGPGYVGLVLEMLNATLNKEVLDTSCNAYDCRERAIGPVSIPSIGVEGAL